MLFCAGVARVVAFKFLKEITILRRILLLGNLYIITLGTLRTFTWKTWEPWGNLYNTTLGTLTTFTWETWESWGNLYNATLESLRKPWQYNFGTLENLLQCNLGNLEGTFTIQPWEPWKTWEPSGNLEETLKEPWGYLEGTLREPWQSNLGNLIETFTMSPWEPGPRLLGNLYIIILGTLTTFTWKTWEPCREPWRNLEGLEGTFWELFGNLEETLRKPWGNLGNLYLGTFTWEPWGNRFRSCSGLLRNLYYGWRPQSFCCWGKTAFAPAFVWSPSQKSCQIPTAPPLHCQRDSAPDAAGIHLGGHGVSYGRPADLPSLLPGLCTYMGIHIQHKHTHRYIYIYI